MIVKKQNGELMNCTKCNKPSRKKGQSSCGDKILTYYKCPYCGNSDKHIGKE